MAGSAAPLLVVQDIVLRQNDREFFAHTCWTWRRGEQWAILGPNGSGKSLLALAIAGQVPVQKGDISYYFDSAATQTDAPERSIALLSPQSHHELITQEASFYQSRWHSGISEGQRTVAQFLSRASVEDINRFEVGVNRRESRSYRRYQRRIARWLGIHLLFQRKLVCLSNGEQRKVLLAHALLRSPKLLILDDPLGGLDVATRIRLKKVIDQLNSRCPVLVVTNRPDELPSATTHLLLVAGKRVVARGTRRAMLRHPLSRRLASAASHPNTEHAQEDSQQFRTSRQSSTNGPASKSLVQLNHVTIRIGGKTILDDVSWTLRRGEHWGLLGPNGSGKTTLLSLIQGDNPQAYAVDIRLFGRRPDSTQTLWQMRQKIGWLSPELHMHYPTAWSCLDVVCSGFSNAIGLHQAITSRQRTAARQWLRRLGLLQHAGTSFGEISLGDQRLVLVARAVVKKPMLLILDEPCQGMDATHRRIMLNATDALISRTGAGLIFVTHHRRELPQCLTHLLQLKKGRAVAQCVLRDCQSGCKSLNES